MKPPPLPETEDDRLAVLRSYDVLDTEPERLYDNIIRLASQICGTPIALVSLVDETRQWFKSKVGLDATHTSRELSFCGHAILGTGVFEINNSTKDERFHDNPLVTGDPQVIFYAGAPLRAPTGEQIGTLCVMDRKPHELTRQQSSMLQSLAEQVVALLELRRNVKMANDASRSKSEFLSNVSHEIRTPLGAILGFTDVLKKSDLEETERQRYLDIVNRNGQMLANLVEDILDLSKVEAEQMLLDVETHDVRSLLNDVSETFSETVRQKELEFSVDLSSKTPSHLRFDLKRLRQVLINVIGNAIKFTTHGSIRMRVDYDARELLFTVTDTGIGMSDEQQQDLFKPFKQADKSITREFGGTGVGLHLIERLCEL